MKNEANNMKRSDEFPEIGKKLPYPEPNDFFNGLAEKTLKQAKIREQNRKKTLIIWRTLSVAASVSALALIGYFLMEPEKPVNTPIAQEKQAVEQPIIPNPKVENLAEIQPEPKKKANIKAPEIETKKPNNEVINDVLADLSDEDLQQLAAMYEADPFINETEQ